MNRPWKRILSLNRQLYLNSNVSSKVLSKSHICKETISSVYKKKYIRELSTIFSALSTKHQVGFGADSTLLNDIDVQVIHNNFENTFSINDLRSILNLDKSDPVIQSLSNCTSVEQLFNIINSSKCLNASHVCQCVLILCDFQKEYYESYLQNLRNDQIDYSDEFMLGLYSHQLRNHKNFGELLNLVKKETKHMSCIEMACCAHYLRKLGAEEAADDVLDILMLDLHKAGKDAHTLSHILAALHPLKSLRNVYMAMKCVPYIMEYLDNVNNFQELNKVTFMLQQMNPVLTRPILFTYKDKYRELLKNSQIDSTNYPTLLNVANFLNTTHWLDPSLDDLRVICELISPHITQMTPHELLVINRILQNHLEPANILETLTNKCANFISQLVTDEQMRSYLLLPHLLFCQVTYSPSDKRKALEQLTADSMHRIFPSTLPAFYKILRYLKPQNTDLCDKFWNRITEVLSTSQVKDYVALRLSNKYMYFNIILSKYRNKNFEDAMIDVLLKFHEEGLVKVTPGKYARLAAFLIAFGDLDNPKFLQHLEDISNHLCSLKDQLDCLECLIVTRGLQIASIISKKKMRNSVYSILMQIEHVIGERVNSLALKDNLSFIELNILVKCHINKGTSCDGEFLHDVIKKYSDSQICNIECISSQCMRDVAYNLTSCRVIIPSLFEVMVAYGVQQKDRLLGETLQKAIWMFYTLGYVCDTKEFFERTGEFIYRDREVINSLSLLQSCTALAYYQALSEDLVKYIFSLQFMERLDKEIDHCYMKRQYPERIRRQLMHLNRAVCLETPEHKVPWFHANYVKRVTDPKQNVHKVELSDRPKSSSFERDVRECLYTVAHKIRPQVTVSERHSAPYGCRVNFSVCGKSKNDKTAIILLDPNCFSRRLTESGLFVQNMIGPVRHQQRQLELLGYRVIHIAASLWNSMHMAEPSLKLNFLSTQIFDKPYS